MHSLKNNARHSFLITPAQHSEEDTKDRVLNQSQVEERSKAGNGDHHQL